MMDELVSKLSEKMHPVEMSLRPEPSIEVLKGCLDRGFVLVKFTGTRGGTEIGFTIDPERSDLSKADFAARTGRLTLVGALTLNYERVRCTATIDLGSFAGEGRLEVIS